MGAQGQSKSCDEAWSAETWQHVIRRVLQMHGQGQMLFVIFVVAKQLVL